MTTNKEEKGKVNYKLIMQERSLYFKWVFSLFFEEAAAPVLGGQNFNERSDSQTYFFMIYCPNVYIDHVLKT